MPKQKKKTKKEEKDTTVETQTETKKQRVPRVRRIESRVSKMAERINKMTDITTRFGSDALDKHLSAAEGALKEAVKCLVELPDDAGRKNGAGSALKADMLVDIKEKFVQSYDGLMPATDMKGLKVVKVAKGKIMVLTSEGDRLFLPKAHVVPQQPS